MTEIKNSIDVLNINQKQWGKRIKELEVRPGEVSRLVPRCGGSRNLPGLCPGELNGTTAEIWNSEEKDQFREDGEDRELPLGHVETQVFEGQPEGLSRRQLGVQVWSSEEVLPAVSSQQTRGNEARSIDNIPVGEGVHHEK